MQGSSPFYLDWQFWAAAAAFVAIVLSQIPPLMQVFGKGKLTIQKYGSLNLTHQVGSPSVYFFVILKNIGGRPVNVQSINFSFKRKNAQPTLLKGLSYLYKPSDQQYIMLSPFEVAHNQTWAYTIHFIETWNRDKHKQYKGLYKQIRDSINEMNALSLIPQPTPQEADPKAYKNLCDFF